MGFSYSKVETFDSCGYKFKLKYIDKIKTEPDIDPCCARYLGTACHEGIENRSIEKAIESYKSNYDVITKAHNLEVLKLTEILSKAIAQVPEGEYEHKLLGDDGFIGFIDCLVPIEDKVYDLLDFKYSNNVNRYKKSGQVHVYKYYFEKLTGNKIRDIYYIVIPKYQEFTNCDGLTEDETKSIINTYFKDKNITFLKINYDQSKVDEFLKKKSLMESATVYNKKPSPLCSWCDYFKYCSTNGQDKSGLIFEEEKQPELTSVELF